MIALQFAHVIHKVSKKGGGLSLKGFYFLCWFIELKMIALHFAHEIHYVSKTLKTNTAQEKTLLSPWFWSGGSNANY